MAGDVMKKVRTGDRLTIPAETFNTFIDTARGFRSAQQNFRRQQQTGFRDTNSGDVTWYVRFVYSKQSPASINVFADHGGYWDGVYGTQTWPIDCSDFTITLTSGSKTAIISNV